MNDRVFFQTHSDAIFPTIGTGGSAGYDFYALNAVTVPPMSQRMVDTGITTIFGSGTVLFLKSRSGLCVKNLVTTEAGVIDSDYRDSIKVVVRNFGTEPFEVTPGMKISQGVFLQLAADYYPRTEPAPVREGGFGSTGL